MADYSLLYRTLADPVWVIDAASSRFLDANGQAVEQLGFDHEEIRSLSVIDINKAVPSLDAWRQLTSNMKVGDSALYSAELMCKTAGVVSVEITLTHQMINGKNVFLAVTRTLQQAH